MRRLVLPCALALALITLLSAAPAHASPALRAGAGQADLTPPQFGYFLGGWTRADRLGLGVSTRLYANALVLRRGQTNIALVAAELFAIPAGLQEDVARKVADLGYDKTTVLLAASHTHSGPGGFANNPTYNTAAPSTETVTDPLSFARLLEPAPADRQLYTFLVDQIAQAIRRADADQAPAAAAWGHTDLTGLTQNRSIEAHLADHGMDVPYGKGTPEMDPDGVNHTIDPNVDVLRVDKLVHRGHSRKLRRIPIGAWSNFADHGTVVHSEFQAYSGDHHASAWRRFTARVRRIGHVPANQAVVNVYPNSDEGDQTAGIVHVGPAAANFVGDTEADAMLRAWRTAGRHLNRRPPLALRWTRSCFCGRDTASGKVAAKGVAGIGFLTGSEEGRGPLYDVTKTPLEGQKNPFPTADQGDKYQAPTGSFPPAVPLAVYRVGDHAIATIPGEATKEAGVRVRDAVGRAMAGGGVKRVVIAGLALEFIQYVTTPEEYGQQSYEGASTLYGPNEAPFLTERLTELAHALATGGAAPAAYDLDPSYGVKPDGAPYPAGADHGTITAQPASTVERLQRARLDWDGGPSGHDRPLDKPFVTAERKVGKRWRPYADDLGVQFLWRADANGHAWAEWEIPLSAPKGTYRLRVTATRYELTSQPFEVVPSTRLTVRSVPGGAELAYPQAVVDEDLTARPAAADGGTIVLGSGTLHRNHGTVFAVPGGTTVAAGAARDRYGNRNGAAATV
ncbi:MAG: neutral ceramidase [Solirubrobacteraceae bacterium]|nr:neutral ceramidase [Solirubrobacteraceae bacterium]